MDTMDEPTWEEGMLKLLKSLVRIVVKCFYEEEDLYVIDVLINDGPTTEERLCDLLKFDVKQIRTSLTTFKADRIISCYSVTTRNVEGKRHRDIYNFIKFGQMVNIVKYKLDIVRTRLETVEREMNKAKSFRCVPCGLSWSDLEAGELFDIRAAIANRHPFKCPFCNRPVKEDFSEVPHDSRQMIIKFNEQTTPIYNILQEIDKRSN